MFFGKRISYRYQKVDTRTNDYLIVRVHTIFVLWIPVLAWEQER